MSTQLTGAESQHSRWPYPLRRSDDTGVEVRTGGCCGSKGPQGLPHMPRYASIDGLGGIAFACRGKCQGAIALLAAYVIACHMLSSATSRRARDVVAGSSQYDRLSPDHVKVRRVRRLTCNMPCKTASPVSSLIAQLLLYLHPPSLPTALYGSIRLTSLHPRAKPSRLQKLLR